MISKNQNIYQSNFLDKKIFFNKKKIKYWINEMFEWLFCSQIEYLDYDFFLKKEQELISLLIKLLESEQFSREEATEIATTFYSNCEKLHQTLIKDLNAVLEFDPAAKSKNEVLVAYPGFFAITVHRIAFQLWKNKAQILARLIAEYAHGKTGIDIHPAAVIGEHFMIDHGTGIVIGETAVIGDYVKIYQGVTLGALTVSKSEATEKRHPTIEDNVTIYANATILGGKTIIGKDAVIGGNVWITNSIEPKSLVYHKSQISIKSKGEFPEAINFSI